MRRFAFRLERLERVRHGERRQAHATLALALHAALARQREREALEAEFREAAGAELPPDLVQQAWALRGLVEWREGRRRAAAEAARREVAAFDIAIDAEQVHAEAARAHRVLERLHERKKLQWHEHLAREEQKVLDELHLLLRAREAEHQAEHEEA